MNVSRVAGRIFNAGALALALAVTGCGGDNGNGPDITSADCSTTAGRNQIVYDIMQDWYYWYDEMPSVNPAIYSSQEQLLAVLTQPEQALGKHYSYLTTEEEEADFLNNAGYVGFGFSTAFDQDGRLFLQESFPGNPDVDPPVEPSPAYAAGMRRGDEITAINGVAVALMSPDQLDAALGPPEAGYSATFDIVHSDGSPDTVTVAKEEVTIPVVAHVTTDLGDGDTTYIFFRSFVNPAFDALDAAFAKMEEAEDTQLVLDLRYNGGGLVSVAEHLGGLIAGIDHEGKVIAEISFNDKHQDQNTPFYIDRLDNTVDVTDLVVITTKATASASEMVINGLQPHINVATVGTTSYGKPVGQSRFDFCESDILRAIAFKVVNSEGEGEYFNGIQPTCIAIDDIEHTLGDPAEASVQASLNYLANGGSCDAAAVTKAMRVHAKRDAMYPAGNPLIRDGWDVLIGGAQ